MASETLHTNWIGIRLVPTPDQTVAVMHLLRLLSTAVGEQGSWRNAGSPTGKRHLTRRDGTSNQRAERTSRDRAISVPGNICKMEVRLFKTILKHITAVETCCKCADTSSVRRRSSCELCRFATNNRPSLNMTLNTARLLVSNASDGRRYANRYSK